MHAYELTTPVGESVFISLWFKPHRGVDLFPRQAFVSEK